MDDRERTGVAVNGVTRPPPLMIEARRVLLDALELWEIIAIRLSSSEHRPSTCGRERSTSLSPPVTRRTLTWQSIQPRWQKRLLSSRA